MKIIGFVTATPGSVIEVMYYQGITGMEITIIDGVDGANAIDRIMAEFGPEYEKIDISKCSEIMEASFSKIERL